MFIRVIRIDKDVRSSGDNKYCKVYAVYQVFRAYRDLYGFLRFIRPYAGFYKVFLLLDIIHTYIYIYIIILILSYNFTTSW